MGYSFKQLDFKNTVILLMHMASTSQHKFFHSMLPAGEEHEVIKAVRNKAKIIWVAHQILVQYPVILAAGMPPNFTTFLNKLDFVNLEFGKLLSWSCIARTTFYDELLALTIGPFVVAFCIWLAYVFHTKISLRSDLAERYMQVFFAMTFVVFGSVSTKVFQTFLCESFDDGSSYLIADYSVSCQTSQYKRYWVFALLMFFVYPIGIPVLYSIELWRNSTDIINVKSRTEQLELNNRGEFAIDHTASMREIRRTEKNSGVSYLEFLYEPYNSRRWWFAVFECMRRLMLSGLLVFFRENSETQLIFGVIVAVFWLCIFLRWQPFSDPEDNYLEQLVEVLLFITLFATFLVAVGYDASTSSSIRAVGIVLLVMDCCILCFGAGYFVAFYMVPKLSKYWDKRQNSLSTSVQENQPQSLRTNNVKGGMLLWKWKR